VKTTTLSNLKRIHDYFVKPNVYTQLLYQTQHVDTTTSSNLT